jgi:hypothetical protein
MLPYARQLFIDGAAGCVTARAADLCRISGVLAIITAVFIVRTRGAIATGVSTFLDVGHSSSPKFDAEIGVSETPIRLASSTC